VLKALKPLVYDLRPNQELDFGHLESEQYDTVDDPNNHKCLF
jgi:hypothetical protein